MSTSSANKPKLVITNTFSDLVTKFNTVSLDLGATGELNTSQDSDVVGAINEIESDLFNVEGGDKRTLASLTTTDKTCIVDAINELDAELGTITALAMGTNASTVSGAIAEIEGVFDASAKGISAGTYAFDITTTNASGISLAAPVVSLTGDLTLVDGEKIKLGTDADLEIYHSGSAGWIKDEGDGNLNITTNGTDIRLATNTGEKMLVAKPNQSVELYHNDNKKLETTSSGASITGTLDLSEHLDMTDGKMIKLGTDDDLEIYHNNTGNNSYIDEKGEGILYIRSNEIRLNKYTGEHMVRCQADGAVTLYHDGTSTLATTSGGIGVTGNIDLDNGAKIRSNSADAITFAGANVTVAGTLSVGSLTTSNSAQTVKLAINELKSLIDDINENGPTGYASIIGAGDLNTAATTLKGAINEIEADLFNAEGGTKRTLASLTTTDKTCIVDAINELKASIPLIYAADGTTVLN
jgi:hypothetical protein